MIPIKIGDRKVELCSDTEVFVAAGELLSVELAAGGHWYGHGFSHVQPYPLESGEVVNEQFAVNNIQAPVWMASAGWVLFADTVAPLGVRLNADGSGRLEVVCAGSPWTLRVFTGTTLPDAHRKLLAALGWPNPPPPIDPGEAFFCTWTQYPRCLTQERIVDMGRQIRVHGYPCSTLIIDDRWESCFGELTFATDFADPRAMIEELHDLGLKVWLWVTPFVNQEAATFAELAGKRLLVPARDGNGAALLKWWGGTAGLVDLTNPEGREWLRQRLLFLRDELGVDGFKIDGGDFKYHPPLGGSAWHAYPGASAYSDLLLALFEEVAPHACETRTAWLSQGRRILWRQGGKDSHWGLDNGLPAMVTLGLHLGLLGYDLLMPDMIPGRVQTMVSDMPLPTDELMVRWTEATALFPLVQYSYFPWNYGESTAEAALAWARVHAAMGDYLREQLAGRTAPLIRPLWYDAPSEAELYTVADEWLLGDALLAAPVLQPGVARRDVVLPPGEWVDLWTGATHGAGRLAGHPAPCPGMPLFARASATALIDRLRPVLAKVRRGTVASGVCTASWRSGLDRDLTVTG